MLRPRRALSTRLTAIQPLFITDHQSRPATQNNQYLLVAKLGSGSCAKVHHAIDTSTNTRYAAKAVRLSHGRIGAANALEREIRILRLLDHPNIVKLHEVLHRSDPNIVYLIMDYATAGTIRGRVLGEPDAAKIFVQVLHGLMYLHGHGFVHQDVKPSNILLFENGQVKLGDFGIGHSFQSADAVVGSPAYQAPEFFDEDCDRIDPVKEDLWSVGVALYEAVFGYLPFKGDTMFEIAASIREKPVEIPESASGELRDLLTNLLCVDPVARFDMEQALGHPFFDGAENKAIAISGKSPQLKQSKSCVMISASVCDDGYSFAPKPERAASSWPGEMSRSFA
jgi:serine/threonine-protein kinase 11